MRCGYVGVHTRVCVCVCVCVSARARACVRVLRETGEIGVHTRTSREKKMGKRANGKVNRLRNEFYKSKACFRACVFVRASARARACACVCVCERERETERERERMELSAFCMKLISMWCDTLAWALAT